MFECKNGEMEFTCKRMGQPPDQGHETVLRLRGLPYNCSKEEIVLITQRNEAKPNQSQTLSNTQLKPALIQYNPKLCPNFILNFVFEIFFFISKFQGQECMDGMDVTDAPQGNRVSVPAEADFLYAYSTVPGYYSWRNSVNGSWFIQSLTKVFEDNAKRMDILRMLTRVNAMVSTYKSRTGESNSERKRQVSSIVSMLRKELYFFPENIECS